MLSIQRIQVKPIRVFGAAIEQGVDFVLLMAAIVLKPLVTGTRAVQPAVLLYTIGGIGDYMLLTASLRGYRELFPNKQVVLLLRSGIEDLARHNPHVDRVVTIDLSRIHNTLNEKLRLWTTLLLTPFDIAINIDYSTHAESLSETIMRWSQAKRRVAFHCLDGDARRDYSAYTEVVPQTTEWVFEIDRNNTLLHFLGLSDYHNSITRAWGIESHRLPSPLSELIPQNGYYVLFPGSAVAEKCWPPENFGLLIEHLKGVHGSPVVCGSQRETSRVTILQQNTSVKVTDLSGQTSLMDLATVIKNAQFVVSNDTSAVHIAAAVGTPAFAIVGGGHYGRFVPYPARTSIVPIINENVRSCFQCYWHCIYDYFKCIADISVADVASVIITHTRKP
jgi:ADP-heptose:LPS heptosyltransferase